MALADDAVFTFTFQAFKTDIPNTIHLPVFEIVSEISLYKSLRSQA